jgi:dynein heavy chain
MSYSWSKIEKPLYYPLKIIKKVFLQLTIFFVIPQKINRAIDYSFQGAWTIKNNLISFLLLAPPNTDYVGYHQYIDDMMPPESPYLYGLHPNAEIGFLTTTSENLFRTVFEMQPRDAGAAGGATVTREDKVKQILDEIMEKLPDEFNMSEIMGKVEERTPYVIVAFQECERMNYLTNEIKRSLKELDLGLKGELTITNTMEDLENALFLDQVPSVWAARAYPSLLGLTGWFVDLLLRLRELEAWSADFVVCGVFEIGYFRI